MSPKPYWSTYSAPFCRRIVEARVRSAVKILKLFYDGKSDPMEHIKAFSRQIELFTTNTDVICKTLATSFTGLAQTWFDTLAPGTITSLSHLCTLLEQRFSSSKKRKMTNDDLFNVQQRADEPLKDFVDRFQGAANQIERYDKPLVCATFLRGLRDKALKYNIAKQQLIEFADVLKEFEGLSLIHI